MATKARSGAGGRPGELDGSARLLAALLAATVCYGIAQAVVAPLLPMLITELRVSGAVGSWLLTGFVLVASVAAPIAGRLGDMYGYVRVLQIVLLVAASGAVVTAAAGPSFWVMLAGRMIQGVSAAAFPLAYGALRQRVPAGRVAGSIGIVSAGVGVGGGAGAVLTGILADRWGTGAVFLAIAVVSASAALLALLLRREPGARAASPAAVDLAGAGLLIAWACPLLVLVTSVGRDIGLPATLALGLLVVAMLALWVRRERRASLPIVDVRLMLSAPVALANGIAFLFAALQFVLMIAIPAFIQSPADGGFGFSGSVTVSGLAVLPQSIAFLLANLLTGPVARRIGSARAVVVAALLASATGTMLLLWHHSLGSVVLACCLVGAGIGTMYSQLPALLVGAVPEGELGSVTGMNQNARNLGSSVGAQVAAAGLGALPGVTGFLFAFGAVAACGLLAALAAVLLVRRLRVRAPRRGGSGPSAAVSSPAGPARSRR